ncbi:hypothetical protein UPYG_G00269420 [Umbra pygmaea]|uniref:Neurotensin/neuromedin N n=1 Tax=Umbra pygmaea TaxID=75934 RepID=A0ABD0WBG1_UMBPY
MQAQLACVLLFCLTCGVLCSDGDQEQKAIEEELLNSLFTSKMNPSKQKVPYWRVSLTNVCRLVNNLVDHLVNRKSWREQPRESQEVLEEALTTLPDPLEELLDLQQICRVLQPRELLDNSQENLDANQNSDSPLKRKSPYIFKRQVKNSKARRPYILKRNTLY